MKDFSVFLDTRRYWAHKIGSWKYLSESLFCQFFPEHRGPHFCSPPELLLGVLKVSSCRLSQNGSSDLPDYENPHLLRYLWLLWGTNIFISFALWKRNMHIYHPQISLSPIFQLCSFQSLWPSGPTIHRLQPWIGIVTCLTIAPSMGS